MKWYGRETPCEYTSNAIIDWWEVVQRSNALNDGNQIDFELLS